jgi:hypothetical protein
MMRNIHVLLALGVATLIAGCESGSSEGPPADTFTPAPPPAGGTFVALYAPPVQAVPYPNDIYRPPGQTLQVPVKVTSPLATALNTLDGFSTTAHISAPFSAPLNLASVVPFNPAAPNPAATLFVVRATGAPVPLVPGVDYTARLATAAGANGTILDIQPLRPLAPDTTYAFIITTGVRSTTNTVLAPDVIFRTVRDAHLAGVMTGNPSLDALLPAIGPLINLAGALGIPGNAVAVAWSVSTQSTSNVLAYLNQPAVTPARGSQLVPMGITTANLGLGLPGFASLYTGALEIVYYGNPTPASLLTSVWVNSSLVPPTRANAAPLPQGGLRRIPVLASLPSPASPMPAKPAAGWPLVVIQHGVTVNRTVMLTMADAFASQGFAVVAIDLPLHGVTDINSPFYHRPGNPLGTTELHFNADNVGPLGDYRPDNLIDNGWQIFNLRNPLNARDHGRQAVVDLIQLLRTAPNMDFDGGGADVNPNRIHFVSLSLGSMFSTALLAVNSNFGSATMSSPGGRFIDFLYDPMATVFGLPIRQAIEAQGLAFGTLGFDNFARDLQTVLDPIEPLNYAATAAQNHPIHVVEVLTDTSVPATLTENVARLMGLISVSAPGAINPTGVRGIVRFTAGSHSSMFDPRPPNPIAVTTEMQTEAVAFALTSGTQLPVANACSCVQ